MQTKSMKKSVLVARADIMFTHSPPRPVHPDGAHPEDDPHVCSVRDLPLHGHHFTERHPAVGPHPAAVHPPEVPP